MAIMPALSLVGAPDSVAITDLGPRRPTRRIGYVTTTELAASAVVRALVRELRAAAPVVRASPAVGPDLLVGGKWHTVQGS